MFLACGNVVSVDRGRHYQVSENRVGFPLSNSSNSVVGNAVSVCAAGLDLEEKTNK